MSRPLPVCLIPFALFIVRTLPHPLHLPKLTKFKKYKKELISEDTVTITIPAFKFTVIYYIPTHQDTFISFLWLPFLCLPFSLLIFLDTQNSYFFL